MNINENNELYELTGQVESIVYRNDENGYTVIELAGLTHFEENFVILHT